MKISVIIPVNNGGEDFRRCLGALLSAKRPPDEIIVVDDASTDHSSSTAQALGAQTLSLETTPQGPAIARNHGAAIAHGDVIVFIDADVAVHEDTLSLIEGILDRNPDVSAIYGSYDDAPPKSGWVSKYKNLLHHYTHQHSLRESQSFWAGCGAVRRDVFLKVQGFSKAYSRPAIEDIELGFRMTQAGYRIWLCAEVQVSHLKQWTLLSLLRSDILNRAIPWTQLIISSSYLPSDLNLDMKSRLSAFAAWASVCLLALSLVYPVSLAGAFLCIVLQILLNRNLYCLFLRKAGIGFCAAGVSLHTLYYLYSSLIFGLLLTQHHIKKLVMLAKSASRSKLPRGRIPW